MLRKLLCSVQKLYQHTNASTDELAFKEQP